ncbi:MAG: hypothetical protein ACXABY_01405 [Candidatus Thorarchaeota archaeon]
MEITLGSYVRVEQGEARITGFKLIRFPERNVVFLEYDLETPTDIIKVTNHSVDAFMATVV